MSSILVTGATGTFGGEVTSQLISGNIPCRVLIRDASRISDFGDKVQVVVGDYENLEALEAALAGVQCVFLASFDRPDQAALQNNVLTVAKHQGVRHVVRISTTGVHEFKHLPIMKWHLECEQQLEQSGLAFTHLRPGWVMQNFLPSSWVGPDRDGKIRLPAGDGRVSFVDARDVAAVAVKSLTTPGHEGKAYEMTGTEALSHADVASQLTAASGRSIVYEDLAPELYAGEKADQGWPQQSIETVLALFAEIRAGNESTILGTLEAVLGRKPLRFVDFAAHYASAFASHPSD